MSAARRLRPSRRGAASLVLCLCLQPLFGCAGPGGGTGQGAEDTKAAEAALRAEAAATVSPQLVPAPALFEATGTVRWDGKRTLQGAWVAHPQASTARRVRIYNAATGAAVDGALFKRDATLSGPSMLVSSDAARMLGIVPGEEIELRVVAVTPRADGHSKALTTPPDTPAFAAEPATLPAASALPARARAAVPRAAAPAIAALSAAALSAAALPAAAPPAAARAYLAPSAPGSAAPGSAAPASVASEEPVRPTTPSTLPVAASRPGGSAPPAAPAVSASSSATLALAEPSPAADRHPARGSAQAEAGRQPALGDAPSARSPASDAALPAATTPPSGDAPRPDPASPLAQPYVQAGLFAVADDADRLIRRLEAAGLPALGKPARPATGPATRVLAGPFATAAERDAARRQIQAMGLGDAVPVAR